MIQIITDSTSDLTAEQAKAWNVKVIPLTVHFGEEAYVDGVDITPEEFYEKLAACGDSLPTTSQINPAEFSDVFESALDKGDEVIGIFISSELSGTYQSAAIAKELLDSERIHLVDSRTTTFALALLVRQAVRLRDAGLSAAAIASQLTALTGRLRLFAVVDTLKYLKLGGRISAATALVGGALGITPIIGIVDGKAESLGKSRGRKGGVKWLANQVAKGTLDPSLGVSYGHTNCPEALEECMSAMVPIAGDAAVEFTGLIGPVVGTHAGPGAAGFAYFEQE